MHEDIPEQLPPEEQVLTPEEEADLARINKFLDDAHARGKMPSDPEFMAAEEQLQRYAEKIEGTKKPYRVFDREF